MQCLSCHKDTPDGAYCTWCGQRQDTNPDTARLAQYAAHPGEHVLQASVFTTLFPHLDHHKIHEFRWLFTAGVALIFLLDLVGLVVGAILCAIFLVPLLYLLYLYEAQIYRDEPVAVVGATIGGGLVAGLVVSVLTRFFTTPSLLTLQGLNGSESVGLLLLLAVAVPVVQEIVKPLPALLLRNRPAFRERVDGLVFGVAAGLGFGVAETLDRFSAVITSLPAQVGSTNWIYPLMTIGLLLPLLQGSTTGAITAVLWRAGRRWLTLRDLAIVAGMVAAHVAFILISQMLSDRGVAPLILLGWQALIVGAVLLTIRYLLHQTLLEEATDMGFGPTTCPNCHHAIMAASFCARCGKALAASGAPRTQKLNLARTPNAAEVRQ